MYPLVYHLGIDEYFPDEDLEPHLFQHVAAWRRANRRPSAIRRLASLVLRMIRRARGEAGEASTAGPTPTVPGAPAIRWG